MYKIYINIKCYKLCRKHYTNLVFSNGELLLDSITPSLLNSAKGWLRMIGFNKPDDFDLKDFIPAFTDDSKFKKEEDCFGTYKKIGMMMKWQKKY